jgi:hypothetical protein
MLATLLLLATAGLSANEAPAALPELGATLQQVRSFSANQGDKLWPGYGTAPFGFLLIGEKEESLLCREQVPDGFAPAGIDAATGCSRFTRARSGFPDNLLAAMPLFGPPSVMVMGTPGSTGKTEADWVRTILHEHFHQWQSALPNYYPRTLALDLTGGDQTGMWMLNYPYPYARTDVVKAQASASRALADALSARGTRAFYPRFDAYLASRRAQTERRRARATHWPAP